MKIKNAKIWAGILLSAEMLSAYAFFALHMYAGPRKMCWPFTLANSPLAKDNIGVAMFIIVALATLGIPLLSRTFITSIEDHEHREKLINRFKTIRNIALAEKYIAIAAFVFRVITYKGGTL